MAGGSTNWVEHLPEFTTHEGVRVKASIRWGEKRLIPFPSPRSFQNLAGETVELPLLVDRGHIRRAYRCEYEACDMGDPIYAATLALTVRRYVIDEAVRRRTTREDRRLMLPEKRDAIGPYLLRCAATDVRAEFRKLTVLE